MTKFTGPSLRDGMTQQFSEAETRALMEQLLRAAETMHGAGLTHGDIKPENILVGPGGGELQIRDSGSGSVTATPTPARACYRSPEQLVGLGWYDGPGVDMWALGCVMAELLTGARLFDAASSKEETLVEMMDMRYALVRKGFRAFEEMEAFRDLPEPMSLPGLEVLAALLNFDPEHRPTASDVLHHRWFADEGADALRRATYFTGS